jgi:hypothetical protein
MSGKKRKLLKILLPFSLSAALATLYSCLFPMEFEDYYVSTLREVRITASDGFSETGPSPEVPSDSIRKQSGHSMNMGKMTGNKNTTKTAHSANT